MLPRRGPHAQQVEEHKTKSLNWFGRLLQRIFPPKATDAPIQPVYGVVMLRPGAGPSEFPPSSQK